ncbi:MAG: hypothetical protein LC659_10485 [Myxococcales bacterium]|nr:hypothetical protein [Myxococcales bacterium]
MTIYAAKRIKTADFASLVGTFVEKFGAEFRLWYDCVAVALEGAAWAEPLIALLVRDVRALPHDPTVWQAASMVLGRGDEASRALDEISARLKRQATLQL